MDRFSSAFGRIARPGSLQARLAWRLAAVLIGSVVMAGLALAWTAIYAIDSLDDRALQAQAEDIARHVEFGADGKIRVALPEALAAAYARSGGAYAYVVYGPDRKPIAASAADAEALFAGRLTMPAEPSLFTIPGAAGFGPFHGYVKDITGARIAVAQGSIHKDVLADSVIEEFLEVIGLWMIPVIILSLLVGVMTIRRGLAPLNDISAQAAAIGPDTIDVRLPESDLPREITPLVEAFNRAIARLAHGFEAQRRFTADVAHELRTPLAILGARVDTIKDPYTAEALRQDVQRMSRIVEQLLRVARLEADILDVSASVDLRSIAAEAVAALAPLAVRQGRELALTGSSRPVHVSGNAPALVSAAMNLIENALAHAPRGSTVEVQVDPAGALSVLDSGPGIAAAERELVFRRFWRRPGNNAPGAGLGLAIVSETARAHGGSVTVAPRPGGGSAFTLRLRKAPDHGKEGPGASGTSPKTAARPM
jgi:signal transduction histidine kinase